MTYYNSQVPHKAHNPVSDLPVAIYNSLTWMGANTTKLTLMANGDYHLEVISGVRLFIFSVFQIIFWVKSIHLGGLLLGLSGIDISEFYDTIAVLTWFLILTGVAIGYWGLIPTHPCFEILKEGFRIQNRIFRAFQESDLDDWQGRVTYAGKWVIARQTEVLVVCLISISIQFNSAPKYLTNVYILLPWENNLCFWIMFVFEFLSMFLIVILWNVALAGLPLNAIYLEYTLRLMGSKISQGTREFSSLGRIRSTDTNTVHDRWKTASSYSSSRPETSVSRTQSGKDYSITKAARDYRELILYSDRLNVLQSFKVLCIHTLLFGQQFAEAFTAFRMLKIPGIALADFAFLMTDMWTAIRQLFLSFKGISFVGEASKDFLQGLRLRIAKLDGQERRYYMRLFKSLKPIYIKQGPNLCQKDLLGCAWMIMVNYYVTAALWQ